MKATLEVALGVLKLLGLCALALVCVVAMPFLVAALLAGIVTVFVHAVVFLVVTAATLFGSFVNFISPPKPVAPVVISEISATRLDLFNSKPLCKVTLNYLLGSSQVGSYTYKLHLSYLPVEEIYLWDPRLADILDQRQNFSQKELDDNPNAIAGKSVSQYLSSIGYPMLSVRVPSIDDSRVLNASKAVRFGSKVLSEMRQACPDGVETISVPLYLRATGGWVLSEQATILTFNDGGGSSAQLPMPTDLGEVSPVTYTYGEAGEVALHQYVGTFRIQAGSPYAAYLLEAVRQFGRPFVYQVDNSSGVIFGGILPY